MIEDARRLCVTFGHVEKLVTLAASIQRKFLQKQFSGITMTTTNEIWEVALCKELRKKQEIRAGERDVVAGMFTLPTANQSWRKVLSMGNLLYGHEPILREITFPNVIE
ncbi:rab3 GTPase-activating catalytic subunit isoform X1 [Olea europaea subsp. europaea]|uniref:Rab3 GTPase-activating catalytic subunit isoform X1 n=1 Tax=Olea europaea subsp. europaea TaxID=158383 RepID=A0A8S0U9U1_OLEEU|nr:rab3 GTPase-activating catalytic subunit isoform X1 [Olea europaea subsp. europaea]